MKAKEESLSDLLVGLRGSRPRSAVYAALDIKRSTFCGWEARPGSATYRRIEAASLKRLLDYYEANSKQRAKAWEALATAPSSASVGGV